MTMGKRAGGTLIGTLAMTAAVVALSAAPALASTPLTVKISGAGKFTAKSAKTVLTDGTGKTAVSVTCVTKGKTPGASANGNIPNGTKKGNSPVKVGTTNKLAFNNCTGPLGKVTTKIMSEPYFVAVDSKTNRKGQTDGLIGGIKIAVNGGGGCTFNVTGSAPGYYTNGKATLTMTPKLPIKTTTKAQLTISKVGSCFGVVKNGQHPTFNGVFTLSHKGVIKST